MPVHAAPHAPPLRTVHTWRVTVVMPDGSRDRHHGIYPHGCAAIERAMDLFPTACRISARRLSSSTGRPQAAALQLVSQPPDPQPLEE